MKVLSRFQGIAFRVLLGLVLLTTVVLSACILAIYAFREASTEIKTVASELIPQINVSAELGTESINLVNRAITIITADSNTELEVINYQLTDQIALINRIKRKLELMVIDQTKLDYFTDIEKELIADSNSLLKLVAKRIDVIKEIDTQLKRLDEMVKTYSDSLDALFPPTLIDSVSLSDPDLKNVLNLWQRSLLSTIIISQDAASVKYQNSLNKLKQKFDKQESNRLGIEQSLVDMGVQSLSDFDTLNLQTIGPSIFKLREEQLKTDLAIEGILAHHALLSDRLAEFVGDFSHNIRRIAQEHSETISQTLSERAILLTLGFVLIFIIATLVFLYVDHHVVSRIQLLDQKIRSYTKDSGVVESSPEIDEITQIETSFSFFTDIIQQRESELRKLGKVAAEERDKAEAANYSKTRLLTAASHDLRQPLQAMSFFLASMRNHIQSDKGDDLYQSLDSSIKELSTMFNSLLDLSDTQPGATAFNLHHFPLSAIFSRVESEYRHRALAAEVDLNIQSTEIVVYSDPNKLYRIVSNLLSNAMRYAPNSCVRVSARECDQKVEIIVSDTGPGIEKEHRENIFTDKYRLSDLEGGLGMGLAIANELAQAIGSKITLNSNKPSGAVFGLTVESGDVDAIKSASTKKEKPLGVSLQNMDIIVVDDNKQVLTSTLALLESWGCCVKGYNDPKLLLATPGLFTKKTIMLTDLHLGRNGSGLELVQQISAVNAMRIHAIITSADQSQASRELVHAMGYRLIHKPLKPSNLAALLRSFKRTLEENR